MPNELTANTQPHVNLAKDNGGRGSLPAPDGDGREPKAGTGVQSIPAAKPPGGSPPVTGTGKGLDFGTSDGGKSGR